MIRLKTLITEATAPFNINAAKTWLDGVELLSINNFGGGKFKISWKNSDGNQRNYVGEAENTKIKTNVGSQELPAHVPHGYGTVTGPGIGTSTGYFANGSRDGFHKYKSSESEGSGQFKNGNLEGYHEVKRNDGLEFKGNYKNSEYDGYGEFKWPSGGWFKGNLTNAKYVNGTEHYSNGNEFTGNWNENEEYDGYGVYTWKNGSKYKGNWKNGLKSGYGVYTWKDGSEYKGYWVNDSRTGYGKVYDDKGEITEKGFYSDDVYVGNSKSTGWFQYSGDELYLYQQRDGDWWAKNVNTQKEYNISTNAKYESSVNLLNAAKDKDELIAK